MDKDAEWHFGQIMGTPLGQKKQCNTKQQTGELIHSNLPQARASTVLAKR
jgi:hypothetical protein